MAAQATDRSSSEEEEIDDSKRIPKEIRTCLSMLSRKIRHLESVGFIV